MLVKDATPGLLLYSEKLRSIGLRTTNIYDICKKNDVHLGLARYKYLVKPEGYNEKEFFLYIRPVMAEDKSGDRYRAHMFLDASGETIIMSGCDFRNLNIAK
jgi:hypothetical protein